MCRKVVVCASSSIINAAHESIECRVELSLFCVLLAPNQLELNKLKPLIGDAIPSVVCGYILMCAERRSVWKERYSPLVTSQLWYTSLLTSYFIFSTIWRDNVFFNTAISCLSKVGHSHHITCFSTQSSFMHNIKWVLHVGGLWLLRISCSILWVSMRKKCRE